MSDYAVSVKNISKKFQGEMDGFLSGKPGIQLQSLQVPNNQLAG